MLLHGLGSESCVWDPVLDLLAADRDVITIDLPGFGRSPRLPDGTVPSPRALAHAVGATLEQLDVGPAHLAGNSLGAWVALELAREGGARTVTGLCPAGLWGPPRVGATTPGAHGRAHRTARRLRPLIPLALAVPRIRHLVLSPFVAHPERVPYRAAWRMISSYARATAYEATSVAMRTDHLRDQHEIDVPVTLAFGERDRLIRPVRSRMPHVRQVVLPGCGHVPMWDDTALVAEVLLEGSREPVAQGRPRS